MGSRGQVKTKFLLDRVVTGALKIALFGVPICFLWRTVSNYLWTWPLSEELLLALPLACGFDGGSIAVSCIKTIDWCEKKKKSALTRDT